MEQTSFLTSKCDSKCRLLHALHKLRKKRARKTSVVQSDSTVTLHTITSLISLVANYIYILVVFGLSTLNSNWTTQKLCKKLANQKRQHMSLQPCGIQTWYILRTNSQTLYIYRGRFKAFATQASLIAKQDYHSKLSLNYEL